MPRSPSSSGPRSRRAVGQPSRGGGAGEDPTGCAGASRKEQQEPALALGALLGAPAPQPGPAPQHRPAMVLQESPFSSRALAALNCLAQGLLFPSCWAANQVLDLQETTAEKKRHRRGRCRCCCCCTYAWRALAGLAGLGLLLLSLPAAALGLLLWLPVQAARRPFAYQHAVRPAPAEAWALRQRRTFTFVSANLCLLPSGLAKFSNLGETPQRAAYMARKLAPEPRGPGSAGAGTSARASLVPPRHGAPSSYGVTLCTPLRDGVVVEVPEDDASGSMGRGGIVGHGDAEEHGGVTGHGDAEERGGVTGHGDAEERGSIEEHGDAETCGSIEEHFPADADFLCLQEVFDPGAAALLRRQLGRSFEHIVYDVGAYGLRGGCGGLKVFNSGLFLASRYPVLAVQYHCYPNGAREDAFSAKGLLSVQVLLGSARGQRIVGYISCTHLQAPAADAEIRNAQLTLGLHWIQLFQDTNEQRGDVVAFDVYCGDLNFDNCSRGDTLNQTHPIFEVYQDPCRAAPHRDQPWAMGTLLNYLKIHEEPVSTPEKLKRTLAQAAGRRSYLAGPILRDGRPDPAAQGPCRGRRLDYVLYREHRGPAALRTEVEAISVVTQLATRSDHLPVVLQLAVGPAPP
ncbi:sphingomyelin phosphodiesterase 5-like [Apteryx mantelli]|uniref:sphingomyelin phosphodiesterase n=1 Tax=Apteryx mantelli TaxID=2696672 RepID=A0ABM4E7Q4_9AVES